MLSFLLCSLILIFICVRLKKRKRARKKPVTDAHSITKQYPFLNLKGVTWETRAKRLKVLKNPPRRMTDQERALYKIKPNLTYWIERYGSIEAAYNAVIPL